MTLMIMLGERSKTLGQNLNDRGREMCDKVGYPPLSRSSPYAERAGWDVGRRKKWSGCFSNLLSMFVCKQACAVSGELQVVRIALVSKLLNSQGKIGRKNAFVSIFL